MLFLHRPCCSLLVVAVIYLHSSLTGYGQNPRLDHITQKEGLADNGINCFYQSEKGFVWMGTGKGLSRYNAHDFTNFLPSSSDPTSLNDEDIYCLFEGDQGILWVGTYEGGLNAFDPKTGTFRHYTYGKDDTSSISSNDVRCLSGGRNERLWVGTWGGGLNVLNKKSRKFEHFTQANSSLGSNNITSLYREGAKRLWVGTWGGGLYRFDPSEQRFHRFGEPGPKSPHNISTVIPDRNHKKWLWVSGWGEGIFRFNKETKAFQKLALDLPSSLIVHIWQDKRGRIWICTEENGLYIARIEEGKVRHVRQHPKLRKGHINTIFQDEAGSIWVGTEEQGVHVLHPPKGRFNHITSKGKNGLSNDKVMSILPLSPKRILVGTYGGGVNVWDRSKGKFHYYTKTEGLSSNDIWTMMEDDTGLVWIGSWGGGVDIMDPEKGTIGSFQDRFDIKKDLGSDIRCIYQDREERIWIGAWDKGLYRFDKKSGKVKTFKPRPNDPRSINSKKIWAVQEDRKGRLWIGTWGKGLNMYAPGSGRFEQYRHKEDNPKTLSDDYIYCFHYQPEQHVLWIGTSNGLNKFDIESKTVERFKKKDGLPSNTITSIEEGGGGYLWISTSKGISRLDPSLFNRKIDNPEFSIFKNYTSADGLQSGEFNQNASCRTRNGKLYFGGVNGINCFQPDSVMGNTRVPPIVITDFKKYGETVKTDSPITYKDHLELSYQDNFFSVEFAALNYIRAEKNRYAFKLEGFDEKWNYTGTHNKASYTNVPGGDYTLKIKGSNNDGVWNEKGIKLKITVIPPFWKTYAFYVACGLFVVTGFYVFYRLRLRNLRKVKEKLEKEVQKRTAQVVEQKNEIEQKNKDITDSIAYAQKIQEAILPATSPLNEFLSDNFILYKPRDLVSGDFYWLKAVDQKLYFTVADCTGHGVPGSMVSVVGHEALNRCLQEYQLRQSAEILDRLTEEVESSFQKSGEGEVKDGMDLVLCCWDPAHQMLTLSAANNPSYLISTSSSPLKEKEAYRYWEAPDNASIRLLEIKADPQPIGKFSAQTPFTEHSFHLNEGDALYMFSDGFPDQFGGPKGKKFMYSRFRKLLLEIKDKPMQEQKEILDSTIEDWMAQSREEQVDDICVMGVRF